MAKKVRVSAWVPDIRLDRAQLDALQVVAKVDFTREQRTAIAALVADYAADRASWEAAPRPKQVVDILNKIENQAASLNSALHLLRGGREVSPGSFGGPTPAEKAAGDAINRHLPGEMRIAAVRHAIMFVGEAARQAAASIVPERGRPGDPHSEGFIRELHAVFEAAGGRGLVSNNIGETSGPFFDLCREALHLAGATSSNDGLRWAIGKAIQKNAAPADDLSE